MSTSPKFPDAVLTVGKSLNSGNAVGTKQDILIASGGGARIEMIALSSTDNTDRDVRFTLNDGTNDFTQWSVTVTGNAGTQVSVLPVSGLTKAAAPFLTDELVLVLQSGWKLRWEPLTQVTGGDSVSVVVMGASWSS